MKVTGLLCMVILFLLPLPLHATEDDLFKNLDRWLEMTPEQQQEVIRHYQEYEHLSPEEKKMLEERYNKYRSLPPDKKMILEKRFRKYQKLTPEERSLLDKVLIRTQRDPGTRDLTKNQIETIRQAPPGKRMEKLEGSEFWPHLSQEEKRIILDMLNH